MKWVLLINLLVLFTASDPSEAWTYEEHPTLSWNDFRGAPLRNAIHAASVNSGMSYSYSYDKSGATPKLKIQVQSQFYPGLSWKKDLNESSKTLLAHEQLHWDITHLFTKKLRHAYSQYRPVKDVKKEIAFIFKKFEKERAAMQAKYDRETRHGTKKEPQQQWEVFVTGELFKVPQ
jgi:hypothetical protein